MASQGLRAIQCSLRLSGDGVLPCRFVPRHPEHIGLAADLTIFGVTLFCPGSGVNDILVPLAAASALESRGHFAEESEIPRMSSVRVGSFHALVYFAP